MEYQLELPRATATIPRSKERPNSKTDEVANTVTHGFGFCLSLIGAFLLVEKAAIVSTSWMVVGCGIYVASLLAVYGASTMSHLIQERRQKRVWRIIDQAVIYLLIAGSYTPFALAFTCNDGYCWVLAAMWFVALAGFATKVLLRMQVDAVCLPVYVLLGWLPICATQPAVQYAPMSALMLVIAGGVCYTVGTLFLANDHRHPHFHAAWHILVICGSVCHYLVMYCYVVEAV